MRLLSGFVLAALASAFGCQAETKIEETGAPTLGSVRARVISSFGTDDETAGISLPAGLRVHVNDAEGAAVSDATISVYPGGFDPIPMVHQGNGRYEVDVLSDRIGPPADEYFFEVESELLDPPRVVVRVPHDWLPERPEIAEPVDGSDHPEGEALSVRWFFVPGADCYDVGLREHQLQDWTWVHECVESQMAALEGEMIRDMPFVFIRVRARRVLGDEAFALGDYYSQSTSYSELRVFLESAE